MSGSIGIAAVHARIAQLDPDWARARAGQQAAPAVSSAPPLDRSASVVQDFGGLLDQAVNTAMPTTSTSIGALGLDAIAHTTGSGRLQTPYAQLFEDAGARHGVDPALLSAIAYAESNYSPTAVSHAGAEGLMQLMPATAKGLGVTDSFDPTQAVDGAARLLAGHIRQFGSIELALAAYNAGGGAVQRHGGIPPFAETQAYVPKVMAKYRELS